MIMTWGDVVIIFAVVVLIGLAVGFFVAAWREEHRKWDKNKSG